MRSGINYDFLLVNGELCLFYYMREFDATQQMNWNYSLQSDIYAHPIRVFKILLSLRAVFLIRLIRAMLISKKIFEISLFEFSNLDLFRWSDQRGRVSARLRPACRRQLCGRSRNDCSRGRGLRGCRPAQTVTGHCPPQAVRGSQPTFHQTPDQIVRHFEIDQYDVSFHSSIRTYNGISSQVISHWQCMLLIDEK